MKNHAIFSLCAILCIAMSFQSCVPDKCDSEMTYLRYDPVFMTIEEANESIETVAPQDLKNPGKIYYYNEYILVNERLEGVHVIDNSDPSNPNNVAFIKIPGNVDMAVKDNILYADNLLDLVAIDISEIMQATLVSRLEGLFDNRQMYPFIEGEGYIVDYSPTKITEIVECESRFWGKDNFVSFDGALYIANSSLASESSSAPSNAIGIGGSMARFTLYDDYLYTVGNQNMQVFDLTDVTTPQHVNEVSIGWGIETIYPYEDKLFIGSASGMFIFENANPSAPVMLSEYSHWTSCDPVVVSGDIAYVTLRGGTQCNGFTNQLEAIDVSNLLNPRLLRAYPMDHPYGLSINDKLSLFVCDGGSGLKVYNAQYPEALAFTDHVNDLDTYDAISVTNELLLVIGEDGLYQYDTSDEDTLVLLSRIGVAH